MILVATAFLSACRGGRTSTSASSSGSQVSGKEKNSKDQSSSSKKTDQLIKTARSFTGTPYKYGGSTRAGIDCSGLTCASYKSIEILLPRIANDQSNFGKTVSLDQLQKGDLVFFTDKKGGRKITHVGLVTEVKGDGTAKFIHASTKLGVVETDLFSTYYKPLIVKAVRVL